MPNDSFVEVVESAKLRPYQAGQGWDSRDTVVESEHFGPITIESLRAFVSRITGAEITEDLLEQLLAEESEELPAAAVLSTPKVVLANSRR